MANERNWRDRPPHGGRNRAEEGPPEDAPGWNSSARAGSHGAGGGYQRGGYTRGYEPAEEGDVHEGRYGVRDESEGEDEARWRGRSATPESWVGEARGRESPYRRGRPNPSGRQPQSWRAEDDYTLSPSRQGGRQGTRGPYTGLGPADYVRSDERIREDVCDRLTEHGGIDAREIRVHVAQGEVTLEGTVEERVEKFMAEEVADTVVGVREVENRLRLRRQR